MNEILLIFLLISITYYFSSFILRLRYPLQSYIKITSAVLLIIFVCIVESSDNQIWPKLILTAISLTVITKEIKTLVSFKTNGK
jgi:hypothetical protein